MRKRRYLPLGTVCFLEDAIEPVIICGYLFREKENENAIYEYVGGFYPAGIIRQDEIMVFNHSDIDRIVFRGYENDEFKLFQEELTKIHDLNIQD